VLAPVVVSERYAPMTSLDKVLALVWKARTVGIACHSRSSIATHEISRGIKNFEGRNSAYIAANHILVWVPKRESQVPRHRRKVALKGILILVTAHKDDLYAMLASIIRAPL